MFLERQEKLKHDYNEKIVEDLKTSNVGQWYSKLKRMAGSENHRSEQVHIDELSDLSVKQQVEAIADKFAVISNMYEPLKDENIVVQEREDSKPHPLFEPHQIHEKIRKMKKKVSNVSLDLPWKLIREFSVELAEPLCNIYNTQ